MLPASTVSFGPTFGDFVQDAHPVQNILELDTVVFSVFSELQDLPQELSKEDLEFFAARHITNPALTVLLATFCWNTLNEALDRVIADCDLIAESTRLKQAFKKIYYASLSNSSSKQLYDQTLRELEHLFAISHPNKLEKRQKKAIKILKKGPTAVGQKALKWQKIKAKIAQISNLHYYTNSLARERLLDLADILLNNCDHEFEKDLYRYGKFVVFAKNVRENEAFITQVAKLSHAFFETEIAFKKQQAVTFAPPIARDSLYYSHFIPFGASYIEASAMALKKLLIKDIRSLPKSPGTSKIALQKSLVATLQQLAQEAGHEPISWKKVRKESKSALKDRVTDKFLTFYWDNYFQEAQAFDLQEFAWSVLVKAPKHIQECLQQALSTLQATHVETLKSCLEEEKPTLQKIYSQEQRATVYKQLFKPLKRSLHSFSEITP